MQRTIPRRQDAGLRGWLEVPLDLFGSRPERHYACGRAFVVWKSEEPLGGIFTRGPQRVGDLEEAWQAGLTCGRFASAPLAWLSDARDFRTDGAPDSVMAHMLAHGPTFVERTAHVFARLALVLPSDWSRAWWTGAIDMGVAAPLPVHVTDHLVDAWRYLDVPADLPPAVAALTASLGGDGHVCARVESVLRSSPTLDLDGLAGRLGMSPRTLQRELVRGGETFAALRSRLRFEHAASQLAQSDEKIEAIAASVGFRSRSHFVTWFRQQTGETPGSYRERNAERKAG